MKIGPDIFKNVVRKTIDSLPLRRDLLIARHFIADNGRKIRVGLNLGFASAGTSRIFSQLGGYWVSVEFTKELHDLVGKVLDSDNVAALGRNGQIPFEDKQFDTIVVASSSIFFEGFTLKEIIKECHRTLDNGGLLVLTLPRYKILGLARRLGGYRGRLERQHSCTERAIFELLKRGFDVLGVKNHSRFFVQLIREFIEKDGFAGFGSVPGWIERILYGGAALLDLPLFWSRGYNITVCARRKGWRGVQGGLINGHTAVVSNAMFYDVKSSRKTFSITRFKGG